MNRLSLFALASIAFSPGCGFTDSDLEPLPEPSNQRPPLPDGPFELTALVTDQRGTGVSDTVDVARDEFGILHIVAETLPDAAYAQGYLTAHDRLGQMELLRRNAEGSVAEIFGALDPGTIDSDLVFRAQRLRFYAEESFAELQNSGDETDAAVIEVLTRYADGVNAYVEALVTGEEDPIDNAIFYIEPTAFRPWTAIDSLMLGRLLAFQLSFRIEGEIDYTLAIQRAQEVFSNPTSEPAVQARAPFVLDMLSARPALTVPTIDGFPNVGEDSGSRSNAGLPPDPEEEAEEDGAESSSTQTFKSATQRPLVSAEALRQVRDTLRRASPYGVGAPLEDGRGSNTWAIGEALSGEGTSILASDQHLDLSNPTIFYPVHIAAGGVNISGVVFPGVPGIVLGRNDTLAWGSTVVNHDVVDIYAEAVIDCPDAEAGTGGCVLFNGDPVEIETFTETIFVGESGTPTRAPIEVDYQIVPHHGPMLPVVQNGAVVAFQPLSVRYTGYQATQEIRALYNLWFAETIDEAFVALDDFTFGGQNWVFAAVGGDIGWTSQAEIPTRTPASYSLSPTNPAGAAPYLIMPGTGETEWNGTVSPRYIPHAINPATGYITTANQDPVGATFDGDSLNGDPIDVDENPETDPIPLYLNHGYAVGYRNARIDELINQAASSGIVSPGQMAAAQLDNFSVTGRTFRNALVEALDAAQDPSGAPADVAARVGELSDEELAGLEDAADRLRGWEFSTPPALEIVTEDIPSTLTDEMIAESVATSIFNTWLVYFLDGLIGDEFDALAERDDEDNVIATFDRGSITARTQITIATSALFDPETLVSGLLESTGQALICDVVNTADEESCTRVVIDAMVLALEWLEGDMGFGSAMRESWRWGQLHQLDLDPLAPSARLTVPTSTDPDPLLRGGGYPRPGDNYNVNSTDPGIGDLNFEHSRAGPAQRMIAVLNQSSIRVRLQIPGGTVFNRASPYYRNLMDNYWQPGEYFDVPHTIDEITASARERHVFR